MCPRPHPALLSRPFRWLTWGARTGTRRSPRARTPTSGNAASRPATARNRASIDALFTGEDVLNFHDLVRKVPVAEKLVRYAVRLAAASRPSQKEPPGFVKEFVNWGAGLRASQFLILGAKARALLQGRFHVVEEDIQSLAIPTLRHRILLNYRAEAQGTSVDQVISQLLETVKRTT